MKHGKNIRTAASCSTNLSFLMLPEALELAVKTKTAKFDETVEIHVRLGVDSRHADQQVRGAVVLPNGTGKRSEYASLQRATTLSSPKTPVPTLSEPRSWPPKIQNEGFMDFDVVIATPDMMGVVGRLGKVLGPRGLMPNPKGWYLSPPTLPKPSPKPRR